MTDAQRPRADILLVTVNDFETKALLSAVQSATRQKAIPAPIDDRVYRDLGAIRGMRVFHALSQMGAAGAGASQQTVERGIRALSPRAVIAVGIAFGVDKTKQAIGDVLVSTQLRLYEAERIGKKRVARGDKPHASPSLVNAFVGAAQATWKGARVRPGLLLSGEKLIDDPRFKLRLLKMEPEAIGGEMEGSGLYVSSSDHKVDWVVVKAICDWADGHKATRKAPRQKLAADNAANFVVHVLSQGLLATRDPNSASAASIAPSVNDTEARSSELKSHLEVLNRSFQQHRAMFSTYLDLILNKGFLCNEYGSDDGSWEARRVELDTIVFNTIPAIQLLIPPEFVRVIRRLRRILSCSWLVPQDIYYELHEARRNFPRRPVEAAGRLYDDLLECYLEMSYLSIEGTRNRSRYLECLAQHHLDGEAKTTRTDIISRVAQVLILEHDLGGTPERARAIREYSEEGGGT